MCQFHFRTEEQIELNNKAKEEWDNFLNTNSAMGQIKEHIRCKDIIPEWIETEIMISFMEGFLRGSKIRTKLKQEYNSDRRKKANISFTCFLLCKMLKRALRKQPIEFMPHK